MDRLLILFYRNYFSEKEQQSFSIFLSDTCKIQYCMKKEPIKFVVII